MWNTLADQGENIATDMQQGGLPKSLLQLMSVQSSHLPDFASVVASLSKSFQQLSPAPSQLAELSLRSL